MECGAECDEEGLAFYENGKTCLMGQLCARLGMGPDAVREAYQDGRLVCTGYEPGKADDVVSVSEVSFVTGRPVGEIVAAPKDIIREFRYTPPAGEITLTRGMTADDNDFYDWVMKSTQGGVQ
jgi:hypothetical protein